MKNIITCSRVVAICVALSLLALTCSSSLQLTEAASFGNVQVNIQTSSSLPDYFTVSIFNTTGYLAASMQTHYPVASFEIPDGQYIFTVTADVYGKQIYYSPVSAGTASGASTSSVSIGTSSQTNAAPSLPYYAAPVAEYGYSSQKVSGATNITIQTQNVTTYPTNTLTVKASYVDGTPAAGATVSASVLGSYYYWGYEPNVVTWTTTQSDGTTSLTTPTAPVQIDIWNWLPVNLPTKQTTVQVTIAGEPINVTVYWQSTYVGLAGSVIIVPPQTSTSITLHVQQSNYWVTPYASGTTTPTAVNAPATSSGSNAVPAQVAQQQQGNPALANYQPSTQTAPSVTTIIPTPTAQPNGGFNTTFIELTAIAIVAIAIAVASLFLAVKLKRTKSNPTKETTEV